jgi:ribosomal protein S18 acetylase RimI-like enzyme
MSNIDLSPVPAELDGYSIRPLQRADALALEWEGEYAHFRRIYARAFQRAEVGHAVLWGLDDRQGNLVGQVFVLLHSETDIEVADGAERAFIHSFRIRPAHRNQGLGMRLMRFAEADLLARRFRWVSLNVASDNPAAMRLYQRLGYRQQHAISGYWSYIDHQGVQRQLHEPGWRMGKDLLQL